MNLIDSMSGNDRAESPTQLNLSVISEGHYSNITRAISEFKYDKLKFNQLLSQYLEKSFNASFYLLAVDVTPFKRKHSPKLEDKTYVYEPNVVNGKPVTIGHNYSHVISIPFEGKGKPPWVIPIDVKRVLSSETGHVVGLQQISELINDAMLPFKKNLTVAVADCAYSCEESLKTIGADLKQDLVLIVRLRSNRIAYKKVDNSTHCVGHPKWYGEKICLNNPHRQFTPDLKFEVYEQNARGKQIITQVSIWQNTVFHGSKKFDSQNYPFTLIKLESHFECGKSVFKKPLFIGLYGKRRDEILPTIQALIYKERFKIEHLFRFSKQNQLMNKFRTPNTKHEESWNKMQMMAYLQLYAAREIAESNSRPWEKYLPKKENHEFLSPKIVQRDFARLLKTVPRFVPSLIPRGRPVGRSIGYRMPAREDHAVIVKKSKKKKAAKPKPTDPLPLEYFFFRPKAQKIQDMKHVDIIDKIINQEFGETRKKAKLRSNSQKSLFPEFDQQNLVQNKSPPV